MKNANTRHIPFESNCGYYPHTSYQEDVDLYSQLKSVKKLANKLRDLIMICRENVYHIQKLRKLYHDKATKSRSYMPGNKIWLNSKYIKTKNRNYKLEDKFFRHVRVLHLVEK